MQQSLGKKRGRGQKFVAYSDVIFTMLNLFLFLYFGSRRNECNGLWEGKGGKARNLLLAQKVYRSEDQALSLTNSKEKGHYHLIILTALRRQYQNKPRPSDLAPFSPPKTIAFIPSGVNKQKIKRIDHNKCNVRASKNAEQAFSTQ